MVKVQVVTNSQLFFGQTFSHILIFLQNHVISIKRAEKFFCRQIMTSYLFFWIFYSEQMIETWQQSHFKAQHEKLTEVGYELPPPVECCFELLASRSLSERLHKTHFLVTALGEMLCNMVWGKFCDLVDCGI